jgi:hypothetical protein
MGEAMPPNVTEKQPDDAPREPAPRPWLPDIENGVMRELIETINRLSIEGLGETPPANVFRAGWYGGDAHGPA